MDNFTFDSATGKFVGKQAIVYTVTVDGIEAQITATDVVVELFDSNKINTITCHMVQSFEEEGYQGTITVDVTFTFSDYGTTEVGGGSIVPPSGDQGPIANQGEWMQATSITEHYVIVYDVLTPYGSVRETFTEKDGILKIQMGNNISYYTKEDGLVYCYSVSEGVWVKNVVDEYEYLGITGANNVGSVFAYGDMTYDAINECYYCAEKATSGVTFKDVYIYIFEGRIRVFEYTQIVPMTGSEPLEVKMRAIVDFDNVEDLILPEVGSAFENSGTNDPSKGEASITNQEEWAKAVTVVNNYRADYTIDMSGIEIIQTFTCVNGVICVEVKNQDSKYYAPDGESFYRYYMGETVWQREEISQDEYHSTLNGNNVAILFDFADVTFMEADSGIEMYYCEEKVIGFITYSDVYIYISNGRLLGFSLTQTVEDEDTKMSIDMSAVFTHDYYEEIILPEIA